MTDQKGFTLIELLLYIAVSAIVLLSLAVFYSVLLGARVRRETVAEVDEQGRVVLEAITQSIRNAEDIATPGINSTDSALTLVVSDPVQSPLTFLLVDGVIMATAGASEPVPLTNSNVQASNLEFENLSRTGTSGNIRITFTLTRVSSSARHEYDYASTFSGSASLR